VSIHAQVADDSIGYSEFRFSLLDVQKNVLMPEVVTVSIAEIYHTDTSRSADNYAVAKIEFNRKDSCWVLKQYDPIGYKYALDIYRNSDTVNQRLLELRKMTLLYHGYDQMEKTGCQFCICRNIPFQKGIYAVDIPRQQSSWLFLKRVYFSIRNVPTEFRDVTDIQNWMVQSRK